jgi:hypothetical protein
MKKNGLAFRFTGGYWFSFAEFFYGSIVSTGLTLSSPTTGHSTFEESKEKGKPTV